MTFHSQSQFLYLSTKGWKTGKLHEIEIWFVEHNKNFYVLSERKKRAHWVQNILYESKIFFVVNNHVFNGFGRVLEDTLDESLINKVSQLMYRKYGWSDGLIVELHSL